MDTAGEYTIDPRWDEYRDRFSTLPSYYFHCLGYPESAVHAGHILDALELEIDSITRQFKERRTELESPAVSKDPKKLEEYNIWYLKAQRAQRMKEAQIRILQGWLQDNSTAPERRIEDLESHCLRLGEAIKLICYILEEAERGVKLDAQLVTVIRTLIKPNSEQDS